MHEQELQMAEIDEILQRLTKMETMVSQNTQLLTGIAGSVEGFTVEHARCSAVQEERWKTNDRMITSLRQGATETDRVISSCSIRLDDVERRIDGFGNHEGNGKQKQVFLYGSGGIAVILGLIRVIELFAERLPQVPP